MGALNTTFKEYCLEHQGQILLIKAEFVHHVLVKVTLKIEAETSPLWDREHIFKQILEGEKRAVEIEYRLTGTPFQKKVWLETAKIPSGEVRTYGYLARKLHCNSPRAVGQALHKNPLPIIIPCHRIVGKDGRLTGFSCGLEVKRFLLAYEKYWSEIKNEC